MEYIQADIWVRFQRMQGHEVHFMGADDAHGAPIMLAAEKAGKSPEEFIDAIAERRAGRTSTASTSAYDNWHSTHSPENTELSQDIYRRLKAAGLVYTKPVEQFFDPVKGMFLADRYIKGECPNCGAKDQYGDACENCSTVYSATELKNPYSTLSGAKPVLKSSRALLLQALRSEVQGASSGIGWRRPAGCSPRSSTRPRNGSTGPATRRSPTGTSRATRRTSASASPTSRKRSTSTSGSTRRSAISPALKNYCARKGLDFEKTPRPKASRSTSSARTSSTSTPCSGRRC